MDRRPAQRRARPGAKSPSGAAPARPSAREGAVGGGAVEGIGGWHAGPPLVGLGGAAVQRRGKEEAADPHEREADAVADRALAGSSVQGVSPVAAPAAAPMASEREEEPQAEGEEDTGGEQESGGEQQAEGEAGGEKQAEQPEEEQQDAAVQKKAKGEESESERDLNDREPDAEESAGEAQLPPAEVVQKKAEESPEAEPSKEQAGAGSEQQQEQDSEETQEESASEESTEESGGAEGEQEQEEEAGPVQAKLRAPGRRPERTDDRRALRDTLSRPGPGEPLRPGVRDTMEAATGADLEGVRVHEDTRSRSAARAIDARAFTRGRDIWLGEGESQDDRRLMAHELTHVVQQSGGTSGATSSADREGAKPTETSCPVCGGAGPGPCPACAGGNDEDEAGVQRKAREDTEEDGAAADGGEGGEPEAEGEDARAGEDASEEDRAEPDANDPLGEDTAGELDTSIAPSDSDAGGLGSLTSADPGAEAIAGPLEEAAEPVAVTDGEAPTEEPEPAGEEAEAAEKGGEEEVAGEGGAPGGGSGGAPAPAAAAGNEAEAEAPAEFEPLELSELHGRARELSSFPGLAPERARTDPEAPSLHSRAQRFFSASAEHAGLLLGTLERAADGLALRAEEERSALERDAEVARLQLEDEAASTRRVLASRAASARARIESAHSTTSAAVDEAVDAALESVNSTHVEIELSIGERELVQHDEITALYEDGDAAFTAAGTRVNTAAEADGERRAREYEARKIHRKDSFTDGHLTDRRMSARAKAARLVAKAYGEGLEEEAGKQALKAALGEPKDHLAVADTAKAARTTATSLRDQTLERLEATRASAQAEADRQRGVALDALQNNLRAARAVAQQRLQASLGSLDARLAARKVALHQSAEAARQGLAEGVGGAVASLLDQLAGLRDMLRGSEAPAPALSEALGAIEAGITEATDGIGSALIERTEGAAASIAGSGTEARLELASLAEDARATEAAAIETFTGSVGSLATSTVGGLDRLRGAQLGSIAAMRGGAIEGFRETLLGLDEVYARVQQGLKQGFTAAPAKLEKALRDVFPKMHKVIDEKAKEAASKEQPAWKSIVKWVLIIAIVIVVAVVVGPFVMGAVAGFVGPGVVATVVGGAIVGAGTSAAIQVVDNWATGRDLTEGLGKAIVVGAIGGGLGGAASFAVQRVGSTVGRFALESAADLVVDTGISVATGEFSLENFGVSALMGLAFNLGTSGLSMSTRIGKIQEGSMGLGNSVGSGARARVSPDVDVSVDSGPQPGVGADVDVDVDAPTPRSGDGADAPRAPEVEANAPRPSDIDVAAPHAPEVEAGAPRASGPEADGARAPEADAVPSKGTSEPEGAKIPESKLTGDGAERVKASADAGDGHEVKVLDDGRVVRCSKECALLEWKYREELEADPRLREELHRINDLDDPKVKAKEAGELAERLQAVRESDPEMRFREEAGEDAMPSSASELRAESQKAVNVKEGDGENIDIAREAGVPDEVLASGTVFTSKDFPEVRAEGLPGRPAPDAIDPYGRRVSRSDIQNIEVMADMGLLLKIKEQSGGRFEAKNFRVDQTQTTGGDADTRAGTNRPDMSCDVVDTQTGTTRRLHVEYDRAPGDRAMPHARRILENDPTAIVILKIIDF